MNLLGTISAGAGAGANNRTGAARASLNLAGKTANDDSVVEASNKGTGGNAVTITFVADASVGVTISVSPGAVVVHFKDAVSTVKDVEDAIAALPIPTNALPLIRVKTPGTPGSVLHATVDEFTATALAGGVGFYVPPACNTLYFQSDTDGVQFEIGAGDSFATTAARGALIPAAGYPVGPFPSGGFGPIVAVWNPTIAGAVLSVYAGS